MEVTAGDAASITSWLPQQPADEDVAKSFVLEYLVIAFCAVGSLLNVYKLVLFSRTFHRQSEKDPTTALLVNQFCLDGFACIFAVVCFSLKISSIQLLGQTGTWLCDYFYSQTVIRVALTGSAVNLVFIGVQLYAEIQHPVLYRKHFRMWMVWVAVVFAWFDGSILNNPLTLPTHIDGGDCYLDAIPVSRGGQIAFGIFGFVWRHLLPLVVLICCYLPLIVTVRRRCHASPGHVQVAPSISIQLQQHQHHQGDITGPLSHHQAKVIKIMAGLSLYFIFAWSPPNIILLYLTIAGRSVQFNQSFGIAVFVGLVNIVVSPVIHMIAEGSFWKRQKVIKVHSQTADQHGTHI